MSKKDVFETTVKISRGELNLFEATTEEFLQSVTSTPKSPKNPGKPKSEDGAKDAATE
jgi:hypothetical protein